MIVRRLDVPGGVPLLVQREQRVDGAEVDYFAYRITMGGTVLARFENDCVLLKEGCFEGCWVNRHPDLETVCAEAERLHRTIVGFQ